MEQEKRRPWRRWVVLVLMIAGFILGGIFVPVQPEITVAAEKLILEPISENFLGFAGPFYLVNTLPTLAVTLVLLIVIAFFTNRSLKNSQNTDLVPRGIGNVMEAILEMLYNLTEGSAGKYAKMIFPWFATIMIYVLFANLLKLIPGFESIGVLHHAHGEHACQANFMAGNWYLFTHEEGEYILAPVLPRYFSGFELHRVAGFDLGGDDPGDRFPRTGTWLFE